MLGVSEARERHACGMADARTSRTEAELAACAPDLPGPGFRRLDTRPGSLVFSASENECLVRPIWDQMSIYTAGELLPVGVEGVEPRAELHVVCEDAAEERVKACLGGFALGLEAVSVLSKDA